MWDIFYVFVWPLSFILLPKPEYAFIIEIRDDDDVDVHMDVLIMTLELTIGIYNLRGSKQVIDINWMLKFFDIGESKFTLALIVGHVQSKSCYFIKKNEGLISPNLPLC
ncbi:hypothetical protein ACJX0J_007150 [Zea mays]